MAAQQVETVSTGADKAKLGVAALLVIGAVVGFYMLSKQGALAQWAALLVGLGAAVVVFMTSEPGKEFVAFGRDSWREARKVVWPSRKEAMQMTAYVFALWSSWHFFCGPQTSCLSGPFLTCF
jgi:preprotein translocase subunit SecE